MIRLLLALLISAWIGGIAILSVQNATALSLKFLFLQSVQMPLGLLLAFAVMVGLMGTVLFLPFWLSGSAQQGRRLTSGRREKLKAVKAKGAKAKVQN